MTDYWREARDARTDDPNRPGFRISHVETDDGGFLFVPDELLVSGAAADLLPVLQGPEYIELTDTSPGLSATTVRWFSYGGPVPLLDHVAALQADARGAAPAAGVDPDACRVTPHYVMSGEPWIYKGGPFDQVRPAEPWSSGPLPVPLSAPHVAVLDTGIPIETPGGGMARLRVDPEEDVDRLWPPGQDGPSFGAEAGHGAFIAGLVNRMTSSQAGIVALRVLDTDGYGTEVMVVDGLHRLRAAHPTIGVINLSLGTRTDGLAPIGLTEAIEAWPTSTVFVAAAGNCGVTDLPYWPAAIGRVVAVAAIGWNGGSPEPAPFSNTGDWVDLCTDGVSVLSIHSFGRVPIDSASFDLIEGWVRWSGTSFAAPIVAAEIARRMVERNIGAGAALRSLLADLPDASAVSPALRGFGRLYDPRQSVGIDPTSP
ncbi:S8 family peptidase [Longivirga aurantiaca]|uniref:S8 family serine peptidase n=1 Tax=Longivirga aurantiaca TaxID=1837743 RepID=A0ABW1SYG2_9ACTN